ncbi:MAG: hypothetical protein JRJ84_08675 [Deltaproteobacteria bacterium]|nr:hypothetical protein [Deltaproteobacteria bacterium]
MLVLASALLATPAAAQFDWGSDCDSGSGHFAQFIDHHDVTVIGEIPVDKRNVRIDLVSPEDVDIQLFDKATGTAIIAWPYGLLSGPTAEVVDHEGVAYRYSGYNGVDGEFGHEYVEILGDTNRVLVIKAFGYAAGQADVTYVWEAVPTCNERGQGVFSQFVAYGDTVTVGDIPLGKTNVVVELDAGYGNDIDIQLVDAETGDPIVAWPNGVLNGPGEEEVRYRDMTVGYSGYNGIDGNWGHESIEVTGTTTTVLTVKAYGYMSGYADVSYEWGVGTGLPCGGTTYPPLPNCGEGLYCKGEQLSPNIPGECHTASWCFNDALAAVHCAGLDQPRTPGNWVCEQFECVYQEQNECEVSGGYCVHFLDTCADGYKSAGPMGCPGGRSANCCLP